MTRTGFKCKHLVEDGKCEAPFHNCHHCHIKGRCSFCRNKDTEICQNCKEVAPVQQEGDINEITRITSGIKKEHGSHE